MKRVIAGVATIALLAGCTGDPAEAPSTGLTGVVVRGPIQPACQVDAPCEDAPFSAMFAVYRGGGRVAQFRSDTLGAFTVRLAPGAYRIVPGPDAPIIDPAGQARDVAVGAEGLTTVQLSFDTGIR
jgi:hypothetical protein